MSVKRRVRVAVTPNVGTPAVPMTSPESSLGEAVPLLLAHGGLLRPAVVRRTAPWRGARAGARQLQLGRGRLRHAHPREDQSTVSPPDVGSTICSGLRPGRPPGAERMGGPLTWDLNSGTYSFSGTRYRPQAPRQLRGRDDQPEPGPPFTSIGVRSTSRLEQPSSLMAPRHDSRLAVQHASDDSDLFVKGRASRVTAAAVAACLSVPIVSDLSISTFQDVLRSWHPSSRTASGVACSAPRGNRTHRRRDHC